jgi:hypothetical protein
MVLERNAHGVEVLPLWSWRVKITVLKATVTVLEIDAYVLQE